ncbi:hypothetical protein HNR19_003981 [Nocardioides thalensis]|uniref:GH16 domain-containing protein n=1 Tax=Nocardioides thalensis TaxID=1914755 RepID=A0A853CAP5_9ACTN|nr:hypothetical protein [Nocardioides thalensis]NYJ03283.1 hypothetical protein [Nocardioides thalensis]
MTVRRLRAAAIALVATLCLVATVSVVEPAPVGAHAAHPASVKPGKQDERRHHQLGTLSVSPKKYYAGQGVRFSGTLPERGVRRVWLEFHMNRPGDRWTRVEGSMRRTDRAGRFSFRHPAPGMYNIKLRVSSAAGSTRPRLFHAVDEMMTLRVRPRDGAWPVRLERSRYRHSTSYPAVTGEPFTVTVDTAPHGGPVLRGRRVILQRRLDATTWRTVGRGRVTRSGTVSFRQDVARRGVAVYRARTDDWRRGLSNIGWNTSFPISVYVLDRTGAGPRPPRPTFGPRSRPAPPPGELARPRGAAGERFDWGRPLFDFAFEWGESLSDRPHRGTRLRGRWKETSTGGGRVGRHNGGLFLESKYGVVAPRDTGLGDRGTTAATLRGNARATGRWEVRMRTWELAEPGASYRVKAELVPVNAAKRACGARTITIADISPGSRQVRYGVTTPRDHRAWRGRRNDVRIRQVQHAYAVEVTDSRITWFLDGRPTATVRNRKALPGVPLTLRFSLVGSGRREMRHAYAGADWIRGWDLDRGRSVRAPKLLRSERHQLGCRGPRR